MLQFDSFVEMGKENIVDAYLYIDGHSSSNALTISLVKKIVRDAAALTVPFNNGFLNYYDIVVVFVDKLFDFLRFV